MHRVQRVSACALFVFGVIAAGSTFAHGDAHGKTNPKQPNLDLVETPFGQTGNPEQVTRTIRVVGTDAMRYTPARIVVRRGETIRFVFKNDGALDHESVLGTMSHLKEHAELMRKFPGMEHDEPYMVHVAPGQSGEMIWKFTRRGEFYFGCLMPGHFEAGMVGSIVVDP
jgi:uncharacterized cupredoxin-like copper-binding protein